MRGYNQTNTPLAKHLRRSMTPWERKLWHRFLKTHTLRWQRQKPIGERIADFYCAKARLVVELDGGGHYTTEQQAEDLQRTREMEATVPGLLVVRFANSQVDRMFDAVCGEIDRVVMGRVAEG
ncbi:endonuclease domain-containing protein [Bifidobacterium simiiventris]|uniref:endonuclease domain-containing protein n=1 Tax=Bifidobacterium simiiventris TaxID=2834434 RepID=UPI001C576FFB|nr:endonuclease domain-containing protein [Bifidobacterium simiiventris]MBW3079068.1 DUF559 domain-containing protein [Bifidobacterium simiiventris]